MATIDRRGVTVGDVPPVPVALVADSDPSYSSINAAANSLVLMNALATGKSVLISYDPNGYSFADNTIALSAGQSIIGDNQVLLKCQTSGYFIHVTSQELIGGPAIVQNVHIDMAGSSATSTAIRFATSAQNVYGCQISQVLFTNCYEAIGDETSFGQFVFDIKLFDIRCINTLGRQIHISRSRGFMWLDSIRIDQTEAGQMLPVTWEGARFENFDGLEINRYDCVGPTVGGGGTYNAGVVGLNIIGAAGGAASVWLNRIFVDESVGDGIHLTSVANLYANWLASSGSLGTGIILSGLLFSQFSNVFVNGANGVSGGQPGNAVGITVSGGSNNGFSNVISDLNAGAAISLVNTTDNVFANVIANTNGGWGFIESGTSDRNIIDGANFASNTSGDVSLSGANSNISNYSASGTYKGSAPAGAAGGNLGGTYPNPTIVSLTFGTGADSTISATSANTGHINQFKVLNSGTLANASTIAENIVGITDGGVNNNAYLLTVVFGDPSNPKAQITTGSAITGGFNISSGAGPLSLTAPNIGVATGTSVSLTAGETLYNATAVPAGGTTGAGLKMSSTSNLGVFFGSGVPTLAAAQGSLYLRTDGSSASTRMYVNTNGSTGWTNVVTAT